MAVGTAQAKPRLITIEEYDQMVRLLTARIAAQALVSAQNPIRLPRSEPQPDLALLRPGADDYAKGHPTPRDVPDVGLSVSEILGATA